jgi:predicted porin
MKKTIVAAAVAALVAAPAAFADVSVGGKIHFSINNVNEEDSMDDHVSRLVFKGSEDLGNGLTASFHIEDQLNITTGSDRTQGRESHWDLSGDFGRVSFGRLYNPSKRVFSQIEQAGDSAIDINTVTMAANNERTTDGSVEYISPNINGLTLRALTTVDAGIGDETDVAVTYSAGGLTVGAGMHSNTLAGASDDQIVVSAKYVMGDLQVGVSTMNTDNGDDNMAASVGYKMGNNKIVAQFGTEETDAGVESSGNGVALIHSMSKTTSVYLGTRDSEQAGDNERAYALGFVQSF